MNNSSEPQDRSTTHILSSTVYAWVVTEWLLLFLHYHPPNRTSKDRQKKPQKQIGDISNFINIFRTNTIQVLNLHGFLCRFWLCPSNDNLKINENIAVGIGTPFLRQEVSGNKANTSLTQCKQRLTHKTGQPHPTAAKQIVPKIFLDPHFTECSWGTPILGISTLWVRVSALTSMAIQLPPLS